MEDDMFLVDLVACYLLHGSFMASRRGLNS